MEGHERTVEAVLHRTDELLVVEIEPLAGPPPSARTYQLTRASISRIHRSRALDELYQVAVEEVSRLTGYDRVMLYRFDDEWNGEVVAERRADRDLTLPRAALPGLGHPGPGPEALPQQLAPADRRRGLRPGPAGARDQPADRASSRSQPRRAPERLPGAPGVPAQHGGDRVDVGLAHRRRRAVGPDRLPPLPRPAPAVVRDQGRGRVPGADALAEARRDRATGVGATAHPVPVHPVRAERGRRGTRAVPRRCR